MLEDPGRGDRGIRIARSVEEAHGARDVARRGHVRVRGRLLREPLQALRIRHGVRRDEGDVFEPGARAADEHELDGDEVLPHDAQPGMVASASCAVETPPSTEFSIAIIAAPERPSTTSASASPTLRTGRHSWPHASGTWASAASVNVPPGPR
jgi:hypothetical protein